ncbi:hypothetical protein Tco_1125467 [Tanacetum coccineum]|uniref:Uncharacterized protein n=1 Tax=Tanacetum coccineum TaxID=301880 RepID=A0ABQ5J925_9ASTR
MKDADGTQPCLFTEDADGNQPLDMKTRLHRALFLSFLGDLVREQIGLKILSWKKVDKEINYGMKSLDILMLILSVLELGNASSGICLGEISRAIENKEIEADEEPPRGIMWLKGRVNKDGEFTDDEIRSVGDKLIKEGTLNLDDGTDAMTVVFGKEKGGYARGVGSGVTYKRYFHLPRSRQATDERIELLQTQLDNEVTPMGAYEVDETQSSVVVRDKDARIKKKSNGLVTSEKVTPPTTIQKISDYNSALKLQSKRKSYVSRETMQRQASAGACCAKLVELPDEAYIKNEMQP